MYKQTISPYTVLLKKEAEMAETRNFLSSSGRTLIAYHYPCPDGIFAALAAYLHFRNSKRAVQFIPNTVYAPCSTPHLQLKARLACRETPYSQDAIDP